MSAFKLSGDKSHQAEGPQFAAGPKSPAKNRQQIRSRLDTAHVQRWQPSTLLQPFNASSEARALPFLLVISTTTPVLKVILRILALSICMHAVSVTGRTTCLHLHSSSCFSHKKLRHRIVILIIFLPVFLPVPTAWWLFTHVQSFST